MTTRAMDSRRPVVLDEATFAAIWRDTYTDILRHLWTQTHNQHDAEDVASETYAKAWVKRDSYNPAVGEPAVWLRQIARRTAIDLYRYRGRRPVDGIDPLELTLVDDLDVAELVAHRVDVTVVFATVWAAVATLPPRYQRAIELRYVHGLTDREAAEVAGWAIGTAKANLSRGLAALRAALDDQAATAATPTRIDDDEDVDC